MKKTTKSIRIPLPNEDVVKAIHDHARSQGYLSAAAYIRALIAHDMNDKRKEFDLHMSWGRSGGFQGDDDAN